MPFPEAVTEHHDRLALFGSRRIIRPQGAAERRVDAQNVEVIAAHELAELAFFLAGLGVTAIVTVLVTRVARRALDEATQSEGAQ